MALPIRIETRTGDTPHSKRKRQREKPPDILVTTPEQLSLLAADPGAAQLISSLDAVILDELHALGALEARRAAVSGARPRGAAQAHGALHRPLGDGGGSGAPALLARAAEPRRGSGRSGAGHARRRAGDPHPANRPSGCRGPAIPRSMRCPTCIEAIKAARMALRLRQHPQPSGDGVPARCGT